MVEIHDTIESLVNACKTGCKTWEEILEKYVEPNIDVLDDYIKEHLDGDKDGLARRIHAILTGKPELLIELEQLYKRVFYPAYEEIRSRVGEGLEKLSKLLGEEVADVNIVFMITGFDSALSAYRSTIYVGVEWFLEPHRIGVDQDNPLSSILSWLTKRPVEFLISNMFHELVHLATPAIKGDRFLSRLLEEGRATYIAWILTRTHDRTTVIPLIYHELREYAQCMPWLLDSIRGYLLKRPRETGEAWEEMFFSIKGRDPECGLRLTGYYIGMYLAQLLHDYYNGDIELLAKVDNTVVLEEILSKKIIDNSG